MIPFIIGLTIGIFFGIAITCCFVAGKGGDSN